ncbi:MAG: LPS export ABC transporter periplasmic protein LptC [Treponema sp.]|nr:LPS export ABC transporter periplasmic protein LptC [Treponema sp.]
MPGFGRCYLPVSEERSGAGTKGTAEFPIKSAVPKVLLPVLFARILLATAFAASCSFDYGDGGGGENDNLDIVMETVEYVRVRSLDKQARFSAERAERFEKRQLMRLLNFSFEQFDGVGELNVSGTAGSAEVDLDSMDIFLSDGVRLNVDSEDIAIETALLNWKDDAALLTGGEGDVVYLSRDDGTSFTGTGFVSEVRRRTWEFRGEVAGSYFQKDEDAGEEGDAESGE